ncbi:MAG: endonuclease [Actinomycetia bacterium]|nr:endonuclease [Actinomycetes bacterium]
MRLLTWNLWWQFGPWQDRQPAILGELLAVDPDVALLQEVWADEDQDQAEILSSGLGYQVARTRRPGGEPHRFGNAVLSRWPVEELEQISLSGLDDQPSHRTALAVRIEAPSGPWVVIVTHLAWQYDLSALRQRQLGEVAELAAKYRGDVEVDPPVIVGGDLNAVPDSDEIRRLTGLSQPYVDGLVFTDSWATVGNGPGHTWSRDNPHSAEAIWPRRRLDYVFVAWPRPKPLGNPLSARLVGVEPRDGQIGSDHYGVLVEVCTDRAEKAS